MRTLLFLFPFCCLSILSSAQENYRLLDQAALAICETDTAAAILPLKQFLRKYPDDPLFELVKLRLGQIYFSQGELDRAIQQLQELLASEDSEKKDVRKGQDYFFSHISDTLRSNRTYRLLFYPLIYRQIKFDACRILASIYVQKGRFDAAIQILHLGKNEHFPHTGCGNGDFTIYTELETEIAKVYLEKRDTSSAIIHLFKWLFINEGLVSKRNYELLNEVLVSGYSSAKINELLDEVICSASIETEVDKPGNSYSEQSIKIFGHKIKIYGHRYRNMTDFREGLEKNTFFQALRK